MVSNLKKLEENLLFNLPEKIEYIKYREIAMIKGWLWRYEMLWEIIYELIKIKKFHLFDIYEIKRSDLGKREIKVLKEPFKSNLFLLVKYLNKCPDKK